MSPRGSVQVSGPMRWRSRGALHDGCPSRRPGNGRPTGTGQPGGVELRPPAPPRLVSAQIDDGAEEAAPGARRNAQPRTSPGAVRTPVRAVGAAAHAKVRPGSGPPAHRSSTVRPVKPGSRDGQPGQYTDHPVRPLVSQVRSWFRGGRRRARSAAGPRDRSARTAAAPAGRARSACRTPRSSRRRRSRAARRPRRPP